MSKISVTEALKLVSVSRTTIYADMEKGTLSYELNAKGRKLIDVAELQRVYGTLENGDNPEQKQTPHLDTSQHNGTHPIPTENDSEIVRLLKEQVELLQTEVSVAREREQNLMDMLKTEQQKTQQLMLPPPNTAKRPASKIRRLFRLT